MRKYEYKVITLEIEGFFSETKRNKSYEEQLNQYGKEGWELCGFDSSFNIAFLKREIV